MTDGQIKFCEKMLCTIADNIRDDIISNADPRAPEFRKIARDIHSIKERLLDMRMHLLPPRTETATGDMDGVGLR